MGKQCVGRLALRVEGDWWVAYFAEPGTMEGAVEMGRVHMAVVADRARKQAFMALMQSFLADLLSEKTGKTPTFGIRLAPQHERAGRA